MANIVSISVAGRLHIEVRRNGSGGETRYFSADESILLIPKKPGLQKPDFGMQ